MQLEVFGMKEMSFGDICDGNSNISFLAIIEVGHGLMSPVKHGLATDLIIITSVGLAGLVVKVASVP